MMVIISISPAMKYSKAICKPPNTTQMMFPNVFINLTTHVDEDPFTNNGVLTAVGMKRRKHT